MSESFVPSTVSTGDTRAYLSVYRSVNSEPTDPRVWQVMEQGMPACAPTSRDNALRVYQDVRRRSYGSPMATEPRLWDGDLGWWVPFETTLE